MREARKIDWGIDLVPKKKPGNQVRPIQILSDSAKIEAVRTMRKESGRDWAECKNFEDLGIVFQDEYILVVRDPVEFSTGQLGTYLRVFERPGLDGSAGAAILPRSDNAFCFLRTFRHATQSWELELPRGWREPNESTEQAARRELKEETGLEAKSLTFLGQIHPNSGLLASSVELFFADCEGSISNSSSEDAEDSNTIEWIQLSSLGSWIAEGRIRDAFSLSALLYAKVKRLVDF